jgi:GDP-L-fucose synthase
VKGKVYIAGHRGMVGSSILRKLEDHNHIDLITRTRSELDLTNSALVEDFFIQEKPDIVILAAARVGGIHANNTYPAEFIHENLAITFNIVHSAYSNGVSRLLNLGSSCIYPRNAPQPMKEDCLLSSPLEKTNEAYAIAKIAGLKMCEYYRKQYGVLFHSGMPTNLYGTGDNYHPENSHVLPALIRKFHEAKLNNTPEVIIWGSGTPKREFLHVDDLADAVIHLANIQSPPDWVNIGSGKDISIGELAQLVKETVGYSGKLGYDSSKPDGTPRKLMDNALLKSTGWEPKISLKEGLKRTYDEFKATLECGNARL